MGTIKSIIETYVHIYFHFVFNQRTHILNRMCTIPHKTYSLLAKRIRKEPNRSSHFHYVAPPGLQSTIISGEVWSLTLQSALRSSFSYLFMLCAFILEMSSGELRFQIDSERQIFEEFFVAILYKYLPTLRVKNFVFVFRFVRDIWPDVLIVAIRLISQHTKKISEFFESCRKNIFSYFVIFDMYQT